MQKPLFTDNFLESTLMLKLAALCAIHGEREALLSLNEKPLRFSELLHHIKQAGLNLNELGIGRGFRLALVTTMEVESALHLLAIATCATVVPLNPQATVSELRITLLATRAQALLVNSSTVPDAIEAASRIGLRLITDNIFQTNGKAAEFFPNTHRDDPALVITTSGTTRQPKTVLITHKNLLARAANTRLLFSLTEHDRCLNLMPLCYMHGINSGLMGPILAGGTSIFLQQFNQKNFKESICTLQITWYTASATIHQSILRWLEAEPNMLSKHYLRLVRSGSMPLPATVRMKLESRLGIPVVESYSSTETGTLTANMPYGSRKKNNVGMPVTRQDIVIMDELGNLLPPDTFGEVAVKGDHVISSYENSPELNARVFLNGWFRTGDLGYFDTDGCLILQGRIDEIINSGGVKISPLELEHILIEHECVEDAIVFPVDHPTLHQVVVAAVVIKPGYVFNESELLHFLSLHVAPHKIPRRIISTDHVAKTPSGKKRRSDLDNYFSAQLEIIPNAKAENLDNITKKVLSIVCRILKIIHCQPDENIFLVGADSLSAIELLSELELQWQVNLTLSDLANHPTSRKIAKLIENQQLLKQEFNNELPVLNAEGDKPPVFVVGGRYGNVIRLMALGYKLDKNQPLYFLIPPKMDWQLFNYHDIPSMAAYYISRIRHLFPKGPYRLLGTSFGGVMVFEMACQLQATGEKVDRLMLLDSSIPSFRKSKYHQINIMAHHSLPENERQTIIRHEADAVRIATQQLLAKQRYLLDKKFDGEIIYFICAGDPIVPRQDTRRYWRYFAVLGMRIFILPSHHGNFHQEPQLSAMAHIFTACVEESIPSGIKPFWLFAPRLRVSGQSPTMIFQGCVDSLSKVHGIGKVSGHLNNVQINHTGLTLQGWIADPSVQPLSSLILVFINGNYIGCAGYCNQLGHYAQAGRYEFNFSLPLNLSKEQTPSSHPDLFLLSANETVCRIETHDHSHGKLTMPDLAGQASKHPFRKVILVVGMVRSGLSVVAQLLSDSWQENNIGHDSLWEKNSLKIQKIHDTFLESFGISWHDVSFLPEEIWLSEAASRCKASLNSFFAEAFSEHVQLIIADPRLCLLLPLWIELFERVSIEVKLVFIVRHPLEIADSLSVQSSLTQKRSLALWLIHNLEAERYSRHLPKVRLFYRSLLHDTDASLELLHRTIDNFQLSDPLVERIKETLSPGLRHHWHDDNEFIFDQSMPNWVRNFYFELIEAGKLQTKELNHWEDLYLSLKSAMALFAGIDNDLVNNKEHYCVQHLDEESRMAIIVNAQDSVVQKSNDMLYSDVQHLAVELDLLRSALTNAETRYQRLLSLLQHSSRGWRAICALPGQVLSWACVVLAVYKGCWQKEWYLNQLAHSCSRFVPVQLHYLLIGYKKERSPHPFINTDYYKTNNQDVAAMACNPIGHYFRYGYKEGRNPSSQFDGNAYWERYPDVAQSLCNPLIHFLRHGIREGRISFPVRSTSSANKMLHCEDMPL
ncbi:MAG: AMP-binding protein [Magnetococcales bacterium]|nr:AMP-binding protein [Magnetococcales bacterium]MBF0115553.1 AMP-binding protein [Magnetococcales bacterium]